MFPELNNILDIGPERPPRGQFVFVNGKGADSSFVLHHLVALYLKGGHNVCFFACAQSYGHYSNIGNKLGVTFNTAKENGTLLFIEGLKSLGEALLSNSERGHESGDHDAVDRKPFDLFKEGTSSCLKPLYDHVCTSIDSIPDWKSKPTLMVIDDVSVLLSLGVSVKQIMNFCHHIKHLLCPTQHAMGCVAIFLHQGPASEDEDCGVLQTYLHHHSSLVVQVEGLRSGYSKDVHGEISIEWRDPAQSQPRPSSTKRMQFKVTDKNVKLFALGMSAAVL